MRASKDQYLMDLADVATSRSTCIRRSVGCVLVDEKGLVLAISYNGVASGRPHCNEGLPCADSDLAPGQDKCEAVHAEQNALIQCADIHRLHACYVTVSPCRSCVKLLLNTPCQKIVFLNEWPDPFAKNLWTSMGREWIRGE